MALYLVRWDDGTTAAVSASNDDELMDLLDQQAHPTNAVYRRWTGPFWVEFGKPLGDGPEVDLIPSLPSSVDEVSSMKEAMLEKAFPNLAALVDEHWDGIDRFGADSEDVPLPKDALDRTLAEDMKHVPKGWKRGYLKQ